MPSELSFKEAIRIVRRDHADGDGDGEWRGEVGETATGWYFPIKYIGSCGRMVNKQDGSIYVFGSAFPLELWLWAYDRGFRYESYDFVVTGVRDLQGAADFLDGMLRYPGLRYLPYHRTFRAPLLLQRLQTAPARFVNQTLWMSLPDFRKADASLPFDFAIEPDSQFVAPDAPRAWLEPEGLASAAEDPALAGEVQARFEAGRLELLMNEEMHRDSLEGYLKKSREERLGVEDRRRLQSMQRFPIHLMPGIPRRGEKILESAEALRAWL